MTPTLKFFFRHPHSIYFSLEKIFAGISRQIALVHGREFRVEDCRMPFPSQLKHILTNIIYARRHEADINHVTGDVHYAILGFRKRKVNVVTIHDCVMLHKNPRGPRHWLMKWLWYELPVKKADAVTVISENTKRELLRFTKCDPEKIRVIPDFVDPAFRPSGREVPNQPPRVLFIGSTPNKNLERLIMALEGLPVRLEIVGVPDEKQLRLLQQYHIDYRQSSGLTQEELLAKYEECDLLAFPTTYEGFGLPIVEAQAVGRPVLTSDLPPMNDVAGDGAVLVDPYRVDAIRQGILSILGDSTLRCELVEKGFRNVNRFRLENIAEQYVSLYRELLQVKPVK